MEHGTGRAQSLRRGRGKKNANAATPSRKRPRAAVSAARLDDVESLGSDAFSSEDEGGIETVLARAAVAKPRGAGEAATVASAAPDGAKSKENASKNQTGGALVRKKDKKNGNTTGNKAAKNTRGGRPSEGAPTSTSSQSTAISNKGADGRDSARRAKGGGEQQTREAEGAVKQRRPQSARARDRQETSHKRPQEERPGREDRRRVTDEPREGRGRGAAEQRARPPRGAEGEDEEDGGSAGDFFMDAEDDAGLPPLPPPPLPAPSRKRAKPPTRSTEGREGGEGGVPSAASSEDESEDSDEESDASDGGEGGEVDSGDAGREGGAGGAGDAAGGKAADRDASGGAGGGGTGKAAASKEDLPLKAAPNVPEAIAKPRSSHKKLCAAIRAARVLEVRRVVRRLRDLRQMVERRREAVSALAREERESKENPLVQALGKAERQTRNAAALLKALKRIPVGEVAGAVLVRELGVAQSAVDSILKLVRSWAERAQAKKREREGRHSGSEGQSEGEGDEGGGEKEGADSDEFTPSAEETEAKRSVAEARVVGRDGVRKVVEDLRTPPAPKVDWDKVKEKKKNQKKREKELQRRDERRQRTQDRRREQREAKAQQPRQRWIPPEEKQAMEDQKLLREFEGVDDLSRPQKKAVRAAQWREKQRRKKATHSQASLARLVGIADAYDEPVAKRTRRLDLHDVGGRSAASMFVSSLSSAPPPKERGPSAAAGGRPRRAAGEGAATPRGPRVRAGGDRDSAKRDRRVQKPQSRESEPRSRAEAAEAAARAHPSWAAAKAARERVQIPAFKGKKVTFDSDSD